MKLCLIYNTAPRYREAIFTAIDKEYDCDWYFGHTKTDIKEMDVKKLKHVKYYKSVGNPTKLYWQGALIPSLFKRKYHNYFILTETRSLSHWTFIILKSLFFRKKKVYGWSHGWYGREGKMHRRLESLRMKAMAGQFVYNERAKRLMVEGGIPEEKIHVIYNSLDYDTQLALRNGMKPTDIFRNHFGNTNPVLIFIGRLIYPKRLDLVLRVLNSIKDILPLNAVFVGGGEQRHTLEELTESLGLKDNVWFYGACYDEKTNAELIYNADLCLSPGNVGLTAIHTLTFGTPVITSSDFTHQGPEFEAIKPGQTGDFFDYGNVESLAGVIKKWFAEHPDREAVRKACFEEIDSKWNPHNQMRIIKTHIKP